MTCVDAQRRRPRGCADDATDIVHDAGLAAIVRAYIARHRGRSREELDGFAREPTVAAVRRAGLAERPDGKRYDHQRRLPRALLEAAAAELARARLDEARCPSTYARPNSALLSR